MLSFDSHACNSLSRPVWLCPSLLLQRRDKFVCCLHGRHVIISIYSSCASSSAQLFQKMRAVALCTIGGSKFGRL